MLSRALALAILASPALTAPLTQECTKPSVVRRDGDDGICEHTGTFDGVEKIYLTELAYFTDVSCTADRHSYCLYATSDELANAAWICIGEGAQLPFDQDNQYAKIADAGVFNTEGVEAVFTNDHSCPASGPGAVFAQLKFDDGCVAINKQGERPGVTIYPRGGSPLDGQSKSKRQDAPQCSTFNKNGQQKETESPSVRVSDDVDCTNGSDDGCSITTGTQHEESVSTSFELSAGGSIEGLFDIGATFGTEYTSSVTSSIQENETIQKGQKGFLSAYAPATEFFGTYSGCNDGQDHDGSVIAIRNYLTYEIVLTS